MAAYPELTDRIVLITGGANGIGAAMVGAFYHQGAQVYFCDTDDQEGARLAKRFPGTVFRKADLRREAQIQSWIRQVRARRPHIDALINNAAADPRIPLPKLTAKLWDDLIERNLRAALLTVRHAAPLMPPGGAIINFSSVALHLGPANMAAYVASKGGVVGLTRVLARELGPRRIRVNTLSPGWIMTRRQLRQFVTPSVKAQLRKSQCIPELIQPEEIAEIALFLASPASRAITGQEIVADRGWVHH